MALDWAIRLYNASDVEQPFPEPFLLAWNFDVLESGGYNGFSMTLAEELDGRYAMPAVPDADWRIDVYFNGLPAYRGWVEVVRPAIHRDQAAYEIQGMGIRGRFKTFLSNCRYAKAYGADASDAWAWFLSRIALNRGGATDRLALGTVIENPLDHVVERMDAFQTPLDDVLQSLSDTSSDTLVWGGDFLTSLDRIYVKKKASTVLRNDYFLWIGRDVTWIEQPRDLAEIVNAVLFTGADLKAPNLFYNGSFELPILAGEGESGNLIVDPSFELGTGWTLGNGASIENGTDPGAYPNTGKKYVNLDDDGGTNDFISQDVILPVAGVNAYRLTIHLAQERAGTHGNPGALLLVQGISSGGSVLETYFNNYAIDVTSREYLPASYPVNVTNAGVAKIRVKITYDPPGNDLLIDDVWLHRADALGQDGWTLGKPKGSNAAAQADWAVQDPNADPYHGVYFLRVATTGTDGGATQAVWLIPSEDHWISTRVLTSYNFQVKLRGAGSLAYRFGLMEKDGSGNVLANPQRSTVNYTTLSSWPTSAIRETFTTGKTTVAVRPFIEFRANGTFEADAFDFFEAGLEDRSDFVPGTQLEFYFRSDNGPGSTPLPTSGDGALSAAAQASIATYGLREKTLSISSISDVASAKRYVAAYLNRLAAPLVAGKVVIEPCDTHFRYVDESIDANVQGMIAIGGADVAIPDQSFARVSYEMTEYGGVRCTLETTNRRPDPALLLASQGSGGGFIGFGGGYAPSSGGGMASASSAWMRSNYVPGPHNSGAGATGYSTLEVEFAFGPLESGASARTWDSGAGRNTGSVHSITLDPPPAPGYPIKIYRGQNRMKVGRDVLQSGTDGEVFTFVSGAYPRVIGTDGEERVWGEYTPVSS